MGHTLAPSKAAWIAESRQALCPLVPRCATGAVRAAPPRQITASHSQPSMSCFRSATGPVPFLGTLAVSPDPRCPFPSTGAETRFRRRSFRGAPAVAIPPPCGTDVDHVRGAGPCPPRTRSERIRSGILIAVCPAERVKTDTRTRDHEPESLEILITPN